MFGPDLISSRYAAALREPHFRRFFIARGVSLIGTMMTPITLSFTVLHVSGSSTDLGLILSANMAANVICLMAGGVLSDRLPRKQVIQVCCLLSGLASAVLSAFALTGAITIPLLLILSIISGGVMAFYQPALQGLVPQLVSRENLQQADALIALVRNTSTFLGPVLGSLLFAGFGPGIAFMFDSLCFFAVVLLLMRLKLPPLTRAGASFWSDLLSGWVEFRSRRWLWTVVCSFGVLNAVHLGCWAVLGPFVASRSPGLGVTGWGLVLGAEAVGMLVTSVVLLRVHINRPLLTGMSAMSFMVVPFVLLGTHPSTIPLMVVTFFSGCGIQIFGTAWNVAMMENVPTELMSRVSSYDLLGSWIAIPIGTAAFGWLASVVQVEPLLIWSGIVYLIIALGTLLVPEVRQLQRVVQPTAVDA